MTRRYVQVTDAVTGDLLSYYEVPAEGYVDALKGIDGVMAGVGALRCEEIGLGNPSRATPSEQVGLVVADGSGPRSKKRRSDKDCLSRLDRDVLGYLWEHEGEPIRKKAVAAALGCTPNQVEYVIRKRLKHLGLVMAARNIGESGANMESSFYVNRDAVLTALAKAGQETVLDLSGYDVGDFHGATRMLDDVNGFHESRDMLRKGELTLDEYMALDNPLALHIGLKDAVMSAANAPRGRAANAVKSIGAKPSDKLGDLTAERVEALFERFFKA